MSGVPTRKLEAWADRHFIRRIGSNHPRRPVFFYNHTCYMQALRKISVHRQPSEDKEINKGFYNHCSSVDKLENFHLIFVGDSHVEFLSRVKTQKGQKFYKNTSAVWLGPITLLGYTHRTNLDDEIKRIAYLLEPTITYALKKNRNIKLIFCIGSIDIRFSIHELVMRKVMVSADEVLDLLEKSMEKMILVHIPQICEQFPKANIDLGVASCTNILDDGVLPTSLKEVKKIRQSELFPTFGTSLQRDKWMDGLNTRIKRLCNIHNVHFFEFAMSDSRKDRYQLSIDGIHLTEPFQLNEDILKYIQKYETKNV